MLTKNAHNSLRQRLALHSLVVRCI